MSLLASSTVLALAWLAALNALLSLAMWGIAARAAGRPGGSGTRLLVLRFLPSGVAAIVSLAVFLPAHLRLEPANLDERFGIVIYALAIWAGALLARSGGRLLAVLRIGRRLRQAAGRAVSLPGVRAGRALEVPAFPGISLAGIVRPRVLIGRPAREALTDAELDVAIAHELAHSRAWDNAKRCAMFCVADLFGGTRASRDLEAAWRAEAERLADEAAVNGDPVRAAVLASALVKVARLAPPQRPVPHSPAWSTFHEPGLLESRVRRLLAPGKAGGGRRRTARAVPVAFAAAIAAAWALGLPARLHGVTELLVSVLP